MANLEKMTIARALQYKKRLAGEIARALADFNLKSHKSYLLTDANSQDVFVQGLVKDAQEAFDYYNALVDSNLKLKSALYSVNSGEQIGRIFLLAEKKAAISSFQNLQTKNGQNDAVNPYATQQSMEYLSKIYNWSFLDEKNKRETVKNLQDEIEKIQSEIDNFNHVTTIMVERVI